MIPSYALPQKPWIGWWGLNPPFTHRRGRGRRQEQVRTAETKDEFRTSVGRDVLFALGRVAPFVHPKTLDGVLKDQVRIVLAVFHVPTFPRRIRLTVRGLEGFAPSGVIHRMRA